ncbi:MAG TPA: hypothetical protein VFU55_02840 [Terracidiphilus sp.]|nr:hypothetical protein [Terracidiphilus sp.]
MKKRNVTIVIDEDLYQRARVWAAQRNTTLSTVVRVLLETVPTMPRAAQRFPLAGQHPAGQDRAGQDRAGQDRVAGQPPAPQPAPAADASAPPAAPPLHSTEGNPPL